MPPKTPVPPDDPPGDSAVLVADGLVAGQQAAGSA